MFKKMQVGDTVVLRSEDDARLLRAIEGHEIANWAPGNWQIPDMTLSVKKFSDSKYDWGWCEKLQCPKWWSTFSLPRVDTIPEGYEPAFEGEEIGEDWMYHNHGYGWVNDCMKGRVAKGQFPVIKPKNPSVTTMEHQDGATTTTVSFGGVGSKFEKNGREYEVTHETEMAHSNGMRQIEIKAVAKPVYGQSPMKPAMDALDAVAEALRILENRPSVFITSPETYDVWAETIEKKEAESKSKRALSDVKLSNAVREKVNAIREQEIASIIQSVVENLS